MKKLLPVVLIIILFYGSKANSEMNYEPIESTYILEDKILTISNNGFLQEIYLCKPTAGECKLIDKAFAFGGFAKKCDGVKAKNIYFKQDKEYFFQGGFDENSPFKIYDLDGNFYGIAPDIKYAKPWCEFYKPSEK